MIIRVGIAQSFRDDDPRTGNPYANPRPSGLLPGTSQGPIPSGLPASGPSWGCARCCWPHREAARPGGFHTHSHNWEHHEKTWDNFWENPSVFEIYCYHMDLYIRCSCQNSTLRFPMMIESLVKTSEDTLKISGNATRRGKNSSFR